MLGQYEPLPFGATLIKEEITTNNLGTRILLQTYRTASGGTGERALPVNAEHRPILAPVGGSAEAAKADVVEMPLEQFRVERRSLDRGDRDPRMPKTDADKEAQPTGERRTPGGALMSLFQEVKSMLLTPSGMIVGGLIVVGAFAALTRGGK